MNELEKDEPPQCGGAASTKRQLVEEMLRSVNPEADYGNDDVLFSRIIDDYAESARQQAEATERERLAELRGRNATIAELMRAPAPVTDGTPRLGSSDCRPSPPSIFDIARS